MPNYLVVWEIELEAESALQAAYQARRIQLDPHNIASVFDVFGGDTGEMERLDLHEQYELFGTDPNSGEPGPIPDPDDKT